MIGCDVQITKMTAADRALMARYAKRAAEQRRTPAAIYAAAQMPSSDCPTCGTPLRYARTARVTEGV